ncbi:MAG: TIGR01777 family oxidoreductase, partial [Vicingaceae bacterium]|nr:TIGR01777 family oxidoreductase [Vicingaceae bacterium]
MDNKPVIVIAGGSGFLGSYLVNYFKENYKIVVLTRGKEEQIEGVYFQNWDGKSLGKWLDSLSGAEALINLSGKSINCRFTDENKQALISSRVNNTRLLSDAVTSLANPPKVWLNASAGAMYNSGKEPNTEDETIFSNSFLSKMAIAWEEAFYKENLPQTRRVSLRISLILGRDGGVFPVLKKITSLFLGGAAGSGKQIMSWMHINDTARAIEFLIKNNIEGPVNFSTSNPKSNKQFMKTLRKVMRVSLGIPAPAFGIKLGSIVLGNEPSLLLDSVNFIPKKLNDKGFKFNYEHLDEALSDLVKNG